MKNILIVTFILLVLCFALLLSVPFWVDVNQYRPQISALIKDKTGVGVKINGDISVHAFPNISLTLSDVALESAFSGEEDVLKMEKMLLNVQLLPLLHKKVEIASFKLVSPVIRLHVKKDGSTNWDVMKGSAAAKPVVVAKVDAPAGHEDLLPGEQPRPSGVTEDAPTELSYVEETVPVDFHENFKLKDLTITNGDLLYTNDQDGQRISVTDINLQTSVMPGENAFDVAAKLNIFADKDKGKLSLKGKYQVADNKYHMENIAVKFDKIEGFSKIDLDLGVADHPSVVATLYVNDIDVDAYAMAGKTDKASGKNAAAAPAEAGEFAWDTTPLDIHLPKGPEAQISFKSSGITVQKMKLGETMANAYLRDGRLTLNLKDIKLYGGIINSDIMVDGAGVVPALKTSLTFDNIDLNTLPKDSKVTEALSGTASGKLNVFTSGVTQKELVSHLNGTASLNAKDGTVKGIDLPAMISNIGEAFKLGGSSNKTRFQTISGDFDITNGIVVNDNFILKSDAANFAGAGEVNLPELLVNYTLTPKFSQDFEAGNKGPVIPILVSGSLMHPTFRLEVKSMVKDLLTNPENAENLVDQIKRDLTGGKDAFKGLKNIFH